MKSIKAKLVILVAVCVLLTAGIVGTLSIMNSSQIVNDDSEMVMCLTNENTSKEINALLFRIEQSVRTLSEIAVEKLDNFSEFQRNEEYVKKYTDELETDVLNFARNTEGAMTAYVRYNPDFTEPTSGLFYSKPDKDSDFEKIEPTDFSMYDPEDSAHVGWYYIPVKNKVPTWMSPYLNENINVNMISYVIPIYIDGVSVGIIGMDIDFSQIEKIVSDAVVYKNGYAFLTSADNTIMYHKDYPMNTQLLTIDNGALKELCNALSDSGMENQVQPYLYSGERKQMVYSSLKNGMKFVLAASEEEIQERASSLGRQIAVSISFAVLAAVVVGYVMSSRITKPIKLVTEKILDMASFKFKGDDSIQNLARYRDETGTMARAVHTMREQLRDMVSRIENSCSTVTESIARLSGVMETVNEICEQNNHTSQIMAAGMEEASASTEAINQNMSQVKEKAEDIFQMSGKGKEMAQEISGRADSLRNNTVNASEKTKSMYQSIRERSSVAIEQSKAVAKINEITETIREISSQTNLLALNASIEAARAGEAGKGFAVVAGEIGNLSGQTFQAVDNISNMVKTVNDAVSNMSECMQESIKFLEDSVLKDYEAFRKIGEQYQEDAGIFRESMYGINDAVLVLSGNIHDMSSSVSEINNTVNESAEGISDIAEKTAEMSDKNKNSMELLELGKRSVGSLEEVMQKFEV